LRWLPLAGGVGKAGEEGEVDGRGDDSIADGSHGGDVDDFEVMEGGGCSVKEDNGRVVVLG